MPFILAPFSILILTLSESVFRRFYPGSWVVLNGLILGSFVIAVVGIGANRYVAAYPYQFKIIARLCLRPTVACGVVYNWCTKLDSSAQAFGMQVP